MRSSDNAAYSSVKLDPLTTRKYNPIDECEDAEGGKYNLLLKLGPCDSDKNLERGFLELFELMKFDSCEVFSVTSSSRSDSYEDAERDFFGTLEKPRSYNSYEDAVRDFDDLVRKLWSSGSGFNDLLEKLRSDSYEDAARDFDDWVKRLRKSGSGFNGLLEKSRSNSSDDACRRADDFLEKARSNSYEDGGTFNDLLDFSLSSMQSLKGGS